MNISIKPLILTLILATPSSSFLVPTDKRVSSMTVPKMSFMADVSNAYSAALADYTIPTETMTSGVLAGVGDVVAQTQTMSEERKFQLERAGRFILKGLGGGLILTQWYPLVDHWSNSICDILITGYGLPIPEQLCYTVSSILLEQFIYSPIVYSLWDLSFLAYMNGMPSDEIPGHVREKIGGLLIDNAKVWTFANIIIYNLPMEWRVFSVSMTDIFWQSIVSQAASEDGESAHG